MFSSASSSWLPSSLRPTQSRRASWRCPCTCFTRAVSPWHACSTRCAAKPRPPKTRNRPKPDPGQRAERIFPLPDAHPRLAAPRGRGSDSAASRRNSAHKNSGFQSMNDPTTAASGTPDYSRSFFGHPRGLATLFMTEFFERFTYYGLRTMLVLFLAASTTSANPGYGIDNATAGAVYALFAGCAYLVTVPGGWIADRLIGQRNAVFSGGIFITIGNFICAIPATPAVFYFGLAFTVIGIGLL